MGENSWVSFTLKVALLGVRTGKDGAKDEREGVCVKKRQAAASASVGVVMRSCCMFLMNQLHCWTLITKTEHPHWCRLQFATVN